VVRRSDVWHHPRVATAFDWRGLERGILEELARALRAMARQLDDSPVYAVALHGVYRELDGALTLPELAASTERTGAKSDDRGFWGARWSPPDWRYQASIRTSVRARVEKQLTAEATRSSQQHWRRTEARYFALLLAVATRLGAVARKELAVSRDFVAFWHDEEGAAALARKTIPARTFARLFAPQLAEQAARRAVQAKPPSARAAALAAQLGTAGSETASRDLVRLGARAVPALVAVLDDAEAAGSAARLLGMIGVANPSTLEALRARIGDGYWPAASLGYLGDFDWLLANGDEGSIVTALTTALRAWKAVPLAYLRLEAFLEGASRTARRSVERELAPGASYVEIKSRDVPEALRGLASKHAVVRWHAASVLGERSLGAANGKRILPALERALADRHPLVRRMAVLSISRWKAAAGPHLAAIEKLLHDRDATVRDTAAYVLRSRAAGRA
jgi:hypothetical protein